MIIRGRRWLAIVTIAIGAFVVFAPAASAHSELVRSDPIDGGTVAVGRSTFSLTFTEPVDAAASNFELRDQEGHTFDIVTTSIDGGYVALESESLAEDIYVLDWQVVADDGHPANGSVNFGVGIRPPVSAESAREVPGGWDLTLVWINLGALILMIGALAVAGRVLAAAEVEERLQRRARRLAAGAGVVAVAAGALIVLARTPRGSGPLTEWAGSIWGTLSGTSWGQLWSGRELSLVVAATFLLLWARSPVREVRYERLAAAALVPAVILGSFTGHSVTLPSRTPIAAAASATHLVAAGVWLGGLGVLVMCVAPLMRRSPDERGPILSTVWRRYSPMAAVSAGLLLASGLYLSGRHLPGLGDLAATSYGNALSVKVLLFFVALALAGVNTMLVNPRLALPVQRMLGMPAGWAPISLRRFTTVVTAEAVVLFVAVGAAAWLTSVPTAREIELAGQVTAPQIAAADGLFVSVEAIPAGEDQDRLIVRANSTEKTSEQPITSVDVTLTAPDGEAFTRPLDATEPGRYEAAVAQLSPGAWITSIAVAREGLPPTEVSVVLSVNDPDNGAIGRFEALATLLALMLVLVIAASVMLGLRRRKEHLISKVPLEARDR
ncbi:MAG: copper resistance protein CopC [Candidatus Nanopelagicales bacterium]